MFCGFALLIEKNLSKKSAIKQHYQMMVQQAVL